MFDIKARLSQRFNARCRGIFLAAERIMGIKHAEICQYG